MIYDWTQVALIFRLSLCTFPRIFPGYTDSSNHLGTVSYISTYIKKSWVGLLFRVYSIASVGRCELVF